MNEQSVLNRLLSAQTALKHTILKILALNRQLKSIRKSKQAPEKVAIKQELRLLNKMADQQAKIVRLYETHLHKTGSD
ncbi:MAG: hypothetical protein ACE5FF_06690 [Saprospiraceae bacterium]